MHCVYFNTMWLCLDLNFIHIITVFKYLILPWTWVAVLALGSSVQQGMRLLNSLKSELRSPLRILTYAAQDIADSRSTFWSFRIHFDSNFPFYTARAEEGHFQLILLFCNSPNSPASYVQHVFVAQVCLLPL